MVANQTMQHTGIENYTAFILPGLLVLVCFGTCSSSGIMNYLMKTDGSFSRVIIAPIQRSSIVLGQMLEAILCSFLEVGIMFLVSLFFSVTIPMDVSVLLSIILLVFLTSFFIAGLCYGISLLLPNAVMYETLMNAIVLPIFFLSTALFPSDHVDGVLSVLIQLNPFTHVINTLRSLMLDGMVDTNHLISVMALFIGLSCISFYWAKSRLQNETNR